jgi:hypothetical protein
MARGLLAGPRFAAKDQCRPAGLYVADSLNYPMANNTLEEEMKAFLSAIIVALLMGMGAYAILEKSQVGAGQKFTSGVTRT